MKKILSLNLLLILPILLSAQNLHQILKSNNIKLSALITEYDSDYNNRVQNKYSVELTGNEAGISYGNTTWKIILTDPSVDVKNGVFKARLLFKCTGGKATNSSVSFALNFNDWSKENYVLMPACAYNGNRFESRKIGYSPKLFEMRDIGTDKPTIISDVPRLNNRRGPSAMSLRSGDLSAPVIGVYSPVKGMSYLLNFKHFTHYGDNGVQIVESAERNKAEISISAPIVRSKRYFIADNEWESNDKAVSFQVGDSVVFEFSFQAFAAKGVQSLFDKTFEQRYDFLGKPTLNPVFSFSSAFEVIEKKFNSQNFVPEHGYYSVGMRENIVQDWQIGWVGGMISTYPLLFDGNETSRNNVIHNFDWLFPNGISPSGFFWDAGEKGIIWYGGDQRKFNTKNWHLIRKSCDGVYYCIKQFEVMKIKGIAVKPEWSKGVKTVADALVHLWKENAQFGQFVNSITGKIEVGGSTSAALAPAALVLAARWYNNHGYLETAIASADYFYKNYVSKGITTGGPGDALQNPDSESAYAMLESFILLYEQTQDTLWLKRAEEMAHQFASWVMPYNYTFPESSLFGKMGMQTAGTVWANTQNKHSAPGICTHSGIALMRLFRATRELQYLELLRQIAFTIPQYLSHPVRPIPKMEVGWMSERINTTDWLENIGEIFYGSTWSETSMLLTYSEIPGVYIVPEKKICVAFDNVITDILKSNHKYMKVLIKNPTKTTATVKVKIERESDMLKKLSDTYLVDAKIIQLLPGESQIITIKTK